MPDAKTLDRWQQKGFDLRYGPQWYRHRDGRPPIDDDNSYTWSVAAQCWQRDYDDDEVDDVDVDTCLGCGRAYSVTPSLEQAWRKSFNYREGAVMEQKCLRCMRGVAPPHEY